MKKTLLIALVLTVSFAVYGQGPLTKEWEIKALATGSLVGTGGLQITVAYNKLTDRLYLPERNNKVNILKTSDGTLSSPATLATLTTGDAWVASNKYTKMRVDNDGVIYACNMTFGAGIVYIYRWASESDVAPKTSAIAVTARTGDSFAVTGTGVNTIIYLSGASNPLVYVCKTTNGEDFVVSHTIALTAAADARSSISAVSNSLTSDLWINSLNIEARRITSNISGTITSTSAIASSVVEQIYGNAEYIQEGSEKYLAVSGANNSTLGLNFKLYKITAFASPPTTGVVEVGSGLLAPAAYTANPNAYADVAYKKNLNGSYTFYNLICNNGLAAYTTASALPVSLSSFNASLKNGQSTLTWSTSSESNNKGFEIQRSTDGKEFQIIDFVASKSSNGNSSSVINYTYVDKTALGGTNYYRLNQLDLDGKSELHEVIFVHIGVLNATVEVYPNPITSFLKVKVADYAGLEYKLYDTAGKLVATKVAEAEETEISTVNLIPSVYILKVMKDGKQLNSTKIIK